MKRTNSRINWFIASLGMVLVVVGVCAGTEYLRIQKQIRWHEHFSALVDRMYYNQRVGAVLKRFHDGTASEGAQYLDVLLCGDILRINTEYAMADEQTQEFIRVGFRQIDRLRPRISETQVAGAPLCNEPDQLVAQNILTLAAAMGNARAQNPAPVAVNQNRGK